MIEVREAEADDRRETARIARRVKTLINKVYAVESSGSHLKSSNREQSRLVATLDGAVIGAVNATRHGEETDLVGLYVDPDYQGFGVAGRLVEAVAHLARKRGDKRLTLRTVRETGNVPVFEELGFQVTHESATQRVRGAAGALMHEAVMELPL